MAATGSLQLSHDLGICKNHGCNKQSQRVMRSKLHFPGINVSSLALRQDSWSIHLSRRVHRPIYSTPYRFNSLRCYAFINSGQSFDISCLQNVASSLTSGLQGRSLVFKLVPAVGIVVFTIWGLGPLLRHGRNVFLHKSDSSWRKSSTYYILTSYLQPLLLWTGALLICRTLDPLALPSEASQIVKQRLLNFVRSLSTVLAFAYCLSSVIQQMQKFFTETNDPTDTRNMGFQFAGKAVYTAVWVAAISLFMELLGFSTQKWLTAGGLGTVLLTLAGREIFTNFLSSAMIHATRPFVVNEWIQTKIEGYEVSGTVEHVGWWSPTIVRGEDREAVHIPNHKFTVNVVRNLSQKTHWRIKTHLAISHLDVNKINTIVADMRKVLGKNPQVEQQRLHRRVFLENINPENQALMILISCFVKTSHFEEYLCVKEAILLDLLRVIRHHRARLATPLRTVQKVFNDADMENIPFAESIFTNGAASNRPLLLIEPPYKVNGEDRAKNQTRPTRTNGEQDGKAAVRPIIDNKADTTGGMTSVTSQEVKEAPSSDSKAKDMPSDGTKVDIRSKETAHPEDKEVLGSAAESVGLVRDGSPQSVSDKQTKKADQVNASRGSTVNNSSVLPPETVGSKTEGISSTSQSKRKDEKLPVTPLAVSKPAIEENIVLGVALEGSKRTLPIEEGMDTPPLPTDLKKLATLNSGNGSSSPEKDKKDGQNSNLRNSSSGD